LGQGESMRTISKSTTRHPERCSAGADSNPTKVAAISRPPDVSLMLSQTITGPSSVSLAQVAEENPLEIGMILILCYDQAMNAAEAKHWGSTWVTRWDRQQELYVPLREQRFEAMFKMLEIDLDGVESPRILDLACGPGAIGTRLVERLPSVRYVGVDIDPVLLHLARLSAPRPEPNYTIVAIDLAEAGWNELIGGPFDAIVSSTALHWFTSAELRRIFAAARLLLRAGGLFLNADNLAFAASHLQATANIVDRAQQVRAAANGAEDWFQWWDSARSDRELAPYVAERDKRFPPKPTDTEEAQAAPPSFREYVDALAENGFTDIDTIWQHFDDRVLVARAAS
jgi:SAM-dependent methyltransferase